MPKKKKEEVLTNNQIQLLSGKIITFNNQQSEALEKIKNWLDNDSQVFTLAGYAGTGKSTILKKLLENYCFKVVVSAPTHKAKKIISETTGEKGQTLHSLLGLRPDINLDSFDPNFPIFNPIALAKICDFDLVIIDEASMINKGLYDLILKKISQDYTKVLFVGDPAQIPPVGEKESVVFTTVDENYYLLTKIERQANTNPLLIITDILRNNLLTIDGSITKKTSLNSHKEGIMFTTNKDDFRMHIIKRFKSTEFKHDLDFCKLIAWRNETVIQSNMIIRTALLGEKTDIVEIGDVLMAYRSVSNDGMKAYNLIENSTDYRVVDKSDLEENEYNIKGFTVRLKEDVGNKKYKYKKIFVVDCNDFNNLHKYAELHDKLRDVGRINKKLWKNYYIFRRNNILMTTITEYRDKVKRESGDVIVKELDYGYAITCHKSQGSTYKYTFIVLNDIELNKKIKEKNQILYVALSRASSVATVLCNSIDM